MQNNNQSHKQYDVFISYGRKDYEREYEKDGEVVKEIIPDNPILKIVELLKREKISCWYDQEGLSTNFTEYITQMIESSKMMIFVSSHYSNISVFTPGEIIYANGLNMKIISFKIDNTPFNKKFGLLLAPMQRIETFQTNPDKALQELITCVKESLREIEKEEQQLEQERLEKERKAQEEKQRKEWIVDISTRISTLVQQEADANAVRQDIAAKITTYTDRQLRKEYSEKLDEAGALHLEIRRNKRKLTKTRTILAFVVIAAIAIVSLLGVAFGVKWLTYNNKNNAYGEKINRLTIANDSLENAIDTLQVKLCEQEKLIDSLMSIPHKDKANIVELRVENKRITLPASAGEYKLKVKSNTNWGIHDVPSDSFYSVIKNNGQLVIAYNANTMTSSRISEFTIASLTDNPIYEKIRLEQLASNDTIILIQLPSIMLNVVQDGKNGIEIKCPFRTNYIERNLSVRTYFYKNNKPIIANEKDIKYICGRNASGEPLLASQNMNVTCKRSGSDFPDFKIFVPYAVFPENKGNIQYKIVFSYDKKDIYMTDILTFSL